MLPILSSSIDNKMYKGPSKMENRQRSGNKYGREKPIIIFGLSYTNS